MLQSNKIIGVYQTVKDFIKEPHRLKEVMADLLKSYPNSPSILAFVTFVEDHLRHFSFREKDSPEAVALHRRAIKFTGETLQMSQDLSATEVGTILIACSEGGEMALDFPKPIDLPPGKIFFLKQDLVRLDKQPLSRHEASRANFDLAYGGQPTPDDPATTK